MPGVVGRTRKKAVKKLRQAGLRIRIRQQDSPKEKGTVLAQSIKKGERIACGIKITLTVSSGVKARPWHTPVTSSAPAEGKSHITKKPDSSDQKHSPQPDDFVGVIP